MTQLEWGNKIPLATPLLPPFVSAPRGNFLHLIGRNPANHQLQHLKLNAQGVASDRTPLPLGSVESAIATEAGLAILGNFINDVPVVAGLDEQGQVIWQNEIAIADCPTALSQLICLQDQVWLMLATGNQPSTVWLVEVKHGKIAPVAIEFDDPTFELRAIPAESGFILARVHGRGLHLQLLHVVDGQIAQQTPVTQAGQAVDPSLVAQGDRALLLWIAKSEQTLCLQWFDASLQPTASVETLTQITGRSRLHSARLFAAACGLIAISYHTLTPTNQWVTLPQNSHEPNRYKPTQVLQPYIAAYDGSARMPGVFEPIAKTPISYPASGWLGNTLFLVENSSNPHLLTCRFPEFI
ncbi:MAG: hypothetical protein F6K42_00260 [Leptolyngbya sp. SIO1D8]|nr:hypothetical protein [Leptolyngbya sp. SIO1D8]